MAANVATDAATNGNTAAVNLIRVFDNVLPTVIITSTATDPTNVSPIPVTFTFSESVTGFVVGDIGVINGTAGNFVASSGTVYTANITPNGQGTVTVSVAANVASDAATNGNAVAVNLTRVYNNTAPTVTISSTASDPTNASPFPVTFTFSESVTGFISSDVVVTNGTLGSFTGSGLVYNANVTPSGQGTVTVSVAANVAINAATNGNTAAVNLTRVFDSVSPTLAITSSATDPTKTSPIPVTFTFNESVTGFVSGDVVVTNGTLGTFAGSGSVYTANVTPTGQGTVTVSVAANVASDAATNGNTAAVNLTRVFDNILPTLTITSSATDPTKTSPISVTFTFNESVTGFVSGDVVVTNGTLGTFAGSGSVYTADVTPSGQGTVTVSVAANVASDAAMNGNTVATNLNRVFDNVAPTIIITSTSSDPTSVSPMPVTFTFNESVTGFVSGDVVVTNGTLGTFAGSGSVYTADVTPAGQGTVTVSVASAVATDAAGNGNTASSNLTRNFNGADTTPPTVVITSSASDPTNASPIPVTITFSETVTGFIVGDISVTNGTAGTFVATSGTVYTANITPSGQGTVTIGVAANVSPDAAANGNLAAANLTRMFDNVAPTVAITSSSTDPTNTSPIPVTITFSESVTGFAVGDIGVTNGTASGFVATSGTVYTANITPSGQGTVIISVAANVATDAAGNGNVSSTDFTRTYNLADVTAPSLAITSSASNPTSASPIPVTFTFSEAVTGFALVDIGIVNGTAGTFVTVSGTVYTASIIPTAQGAVTVSVAANSAVDAAGNNNTAATDFSITYNPVKSDQTITFDIIANKTIGDVPFTISATATSNLAVTFSTTSDKITLIGNQVTLAKAGQATIIANQSGNTLFNAALSVSRTFCNSPAKPTISLSGANTEVTLLTSTAAAGNQWFKDGVVISGAINQTLSVTTPGVYSVQVTVETCSSLKSNDTPVIVTGVEPTSSKVLSVYPNPSSEKITVAIPGGQGGQIRMASLDGRYVVDIYSTQNQEDIRVSAFASGQYLIMVNTTTGSYKTRFIKN